MGFSYNDITSKSMGLKARLTSWQVSGSLRNFTTTVPGKYGVTDFGADFDYREIVVSCNIFPRHSFFALVSTLDDIAAWLDPVGGLKQLVLDDVPDRYFMARLNAAVECERLLRSSGSFAHSSGNSPVKSVCLFSIVFSAITAHLHRLLAWISSPVNVAFSAVTETVLLPTARVGKFSSSRYGRAFRRIIPSASST